MTSFSFAVCSYELLLLWLSVGNSLAVQWLRLSTFTAKVPGLIPTQVTKIPQDWGPKKMCAKHKSVFNVKF